MIQCHLNFFLVGTGIIDSRPLDYELYVLCPQGRESKAYYLPFNNYVYIIITLYYNFFINKEPQPTITSTSITTYVSTNSQQTTVKLPTHESLMIDSSLLGSLIGVCSIIVISLISIILVVVTVIFKRRG